MIRGSDRWRREAWGQPCNMDHIVSVTWPSGARLWVHKDAVAAFTLLGDILHRHNYIARPAVTGAYNCRKITGGRSMSSHAWGIAADVNWDTNPYGGDLVTDMPASMIDAILAVRTRKGVPVFRWGGHFRSSKDAMHFEIIATPQELAEGLDGPVENPDVGNPVLKKGDRGMHVSRLQAALNISGPDIFGPLTEKAVRHFQQQHGMVVDGIVGEQTWKRIEDHEKGVG